MRIMVLATDFKPNLGGIAELAGHKDQPDGSGSLPRPPVIGFAHLWRSSEGSEAMGFGLLKHQDNVELWKFPTSVLRDLVWTMLDN